MYMSYYQKLLKYKSDFVISSFEEAIHRSPDVIKSLNEKFDEKFVIPDQEFVDERAVQWLKKPARKHIRLKQDDGHIALKDTILAQMSNSQYQETIKKA